MASVRVRTRRRSPNANAPLSVQFTSNKVADPLAAQAASWDKQLKLAEDLNAMRKLSDGHTDQFMAFAKARLDDPDLDAEQKAYWQGWLKDSERKVAEETLASEIAGGTKKLEDLRDYTEKRLREVGSGSSEYPKLVRQLADVKQGILARDFNAEIASAQYKLVSTGNRQGYLDALQGIATRTRSPEAQAGLAEQIGKLRLEIEKERTTARSAQANKKLVGYYEGEVPRAEILQYLQDMAGSAGSTAEANHYTTLAAQIDTRERTLQRQALSAATSGGIKALEASLYAYEEGYKGVDAKLVESLRTAKGDRGPLEDAYNTFEQEADDYEAALREALAGAQTVAARKAINTDLNALIKNVAERKKQVSGAVTDNILENATDLLRQADETDDPEMASQFRFLAMGELAAGLKDDLASLNGDQVERLKKKQTETQAAQRKAISKEAEIVAGKGDVYSKSIDTSFGAYQDAYRRYDAAQNAAIGAAEKALIAANAGRNQGEKKKAAEALEKARAARKVVGPMAGIDAFIEAVQSGDISKLGLSSENTEAAGVFGGWSSNVSQAAREQQQKVAAAQAKLNVLVAPRNGDGRRPEGGAVGGYQEGRAGLGGMVPPAIVPTSFAPDDGSDMLDAVAAPEPVKTSASKGPGMMRVEMPDDDPDDPYSSAERNAFAFLSMPTELEYPGFELTPPPDVPDFEMDDDSVSDAPLRLRTGLRDHVDGVLGGFQERPGRGMGGAMPSLTGAPVGGGTDANISA